jgi:glutamate synthase (NADPH/NADH) small chain
MTVPRVNAGYRPKEERIRDFKPWRKSRFQKFCVNSLALHGLWRSFCHGMGCPLKNVIPEFNHAAVIGEWKEALEILLSTSPFPNLRVSFVPRSAKVPV